MDTEDQARRRAEIDCVLHGVELISRQIEYYSDWRAAMLREFDNIESNLPRYFDIARELSLLKPSKRIVMAGELLSPESPDECSDG